MVLTRRFGTPGLFCRKIRFLRQSLSYPAAFRAAEGFFCAGRRLSKKSMFRMKVHVFLFPPKSGGSCLFWALNAKISPEKGGIFPENGRFPGRNTEGDLLPGIGKSQEKYRYKHQNIPGFLPYSFLECILKRPYSCVIIVKKLSWSSEKFSHSGHIFYDKEVRVTAGTGW